ncbi:MAG: mycothiol synthase [Streptosporangiaceae bacterium]
MTDRRLVVTERPTFEQVGDVRRIVENATDRDGVRPLSEHVLLHLRYGGEAPARNLLLYADDALAGYAHLDPTDPVEGPSAELTVGPDHRGRGHGRALVEALLAESPDGRLRLWAHGSHPGAAALAESMGFERIRSLWQMRRSLLQPLPRPELPPDVALRTFEIGRDERSWVEVNARAFADHPEQGAWSIDELKLREREPWFDPAGFFLAERGGRLAGFHWTKVHDGDGGASHGHDPIGEVYVVGVDPDARGGGLGRALTLVGLRYLRSLGLSQVMLYVDESNTAAIRLYESLGFARFDVDVMFRRGLTRR